MPSEAVVKTIGLIIAPVVMITACSIMQNGLIAHYNSLEERIRQVNHKIISLLETDLSQNSIKTELPENLDSQLALKADRLHHLEHHLLPHLFHRHHILHDVLGLVYLAILTQILDMLVIAIAVTTDVGWLSQLVLGVFLIGIGILFAGIVLVSYELRTSHESIQLETHHNCQQCKQKSYKSKRSPRNHASQ
ncbi:hypothetical protein APA_3835 [Pseudanabaena sp. lw0831]|uniref:DUF2721 domain-containing protein n=1 Tax=Pseudanabaena sp. lw0831 TaxID=1357935 RepID=UPI0019169799|nr:DUF2721 domain-containing protein [Pseudanabaena sp. lw0831]GBO55684.1 hypothetical protein APA_3835 [Pseudanabaena sp. lw0831]